MTVRAKFKVEKYETSLRRTPDGKDTELRTITLFPVTRDSEENARFFTYTPSGQIQLGTLNPEAWKEFDLGSEVYVDFTRAAES